MYNSNVLNLKSFEESRALPIFTRGIICGVKYWHELGQDLAVELSAQTFPFQSVPKFELHVKFLAPVSVCTSEYAHSL